MSGQWYGIIGVLLSVLGSIVVARLSARAQDQKALADADVTAGQLALAIAKEAKVSANAAEDEVRKLNRWRRTVTTKWWPNHDERDRVIEMHLNALDPGFAKDLPDREPMPEVEE